MTNFVETFADETAYNEFKDSSKYVTPNVSVCSGGGGSVFYNPKVYSLDYFTTVAKSSGSIIFNGSTTANTLSYSTDNGATWSTASQTPSVAVNAGEKVLWKGNCTPSSTFYGIGKFTNGTATFDVEGNVMSLLFGDNFKGQTSLTGKDGAFSSLFSGNTKVISAKNLILPATTLAYCCYYRMFSGCTSLTTASELPATTLAESCYATMFYGCTSLTTAPELPATTLAHACYQDMFRGCTSLSTAPELPAMTLDFACYSGMFNGCTSLTTAPSVLPATTLTESCYREMFYGCTSLTTTPSVLPATALTQGCYSNMFYGCTSLISAPELPAMTLADRCYMDMFNGCTSLISAPELPAMTLVARCYNCMFSGCTNLSSITCLATNIQATESTTDWVSDVAATGTFTKAASMTSWTTGTSGIPTGWEVEDKS